jgi:hypothetical protein
MSRKGPGCDVLVLGSVALRPRGIGAWLSGIEPGVNHVSADSPLRTPIDRVHVDRPSLRPSTA